MRRAAGGGQGTDVGWRPRGPQDYLSCSSVWGQEHTARPAPALCLHQLPPGPESVLGTPRALCWPWMLGPALAATGRRSVPSAELTCPLPDPTGSASLWGPDLIHVGAEGRDRAQSGDRAGGPSWWPGGSALSSLPSASPAEELEAWTGGASLFHRPDPCSRGGLPLTRASHFF